MNIWWGRSFSKKMTKKNLAQETFKEPESAEPEVIFPLTSEDTDPGKGFSTMFQILIILLVGGAGYFFGLMSNPDSMETAEKTVQKWSGTLKEKGQPLMNQLEKRITGKNTTSTTEPMEKMQTGSSGKKGKIKFWRAPMDPGFISDKPGKSPMGMDLVPVYEDEDMGKGVRINPTVAHNIGVKTVKAKRRQLTREIRTVGRLTYDERLLTHVHTKYEGWIEKLYVDFTGQEVRKGDTLVEIYSPDLVSTQEELLLGIKYRETLEESPFIDIKKGADSLLQSTIQRLKLFDVPQHQIEELISEKRIKKTIHIHSHHHGFVAKKNATHGMHVLPGMPLYSIVDLSNIWVMADIYEYELPWIKLGQAVEMSLSYFPSKKFKGKVTFIDPFLDPKTRTVKVRMEFDNPGWDLKPEMYANVVFESEVKQPTVVVPEQAVIHSGEQNVVVVQNRKGEFNSRRVELGVQAEGFYQVLKGIRSGEKVVVSSNFLIDSESKLTEALHKMDSGPK